MVQWDICTELWYGAMGWSVLSSGGEADLCGGTVWCYGMMCTELRYGGTRWSGGSRNGGPSAV
eukprot:3936300-Rhodomonas_salina.1